MFVRLGWTNSLRQLGRSLLVLLAMVLAAMSLTSALSFSEGNAENSYQFYRSFLGGEILATPVKWAGQHLSDVTGNGRLSFQKLNPTGHNWLEILYPELYVDGFLANTDKASRQYFLPEELAALADSPGVNGVSTSPYLGGYITNATQMSAKRIPVTIIPAPADGLLPGLDSYQADIQAFANADAPIAMINSYVKVPNALMEEAAKTVPDELVVSDSETIRPTLDEIFERKLVVGRTRVIEQMQLPREYDTATLTIPNLRSGETEGYVPDYSQAKEYDLQIVSRLSIPTRSLAWTDEMGNTTGETAYLHGLYVWVPQSTWQRMFQEASGDTQPLATNVALKVADMSKLDTIIKQLNRQFPQFTFVGVDALAQRLEASSLLDQFYRAPSHVYRPGESQGLGVPMKLGRIMGILFYLIAGMLIASRMLTGAAARRMEVGILKSLGARRRDIVVMVLTEALLIALLGTSVGFLLVRAGGAILELGNGVPWKLVLGQTGVEFAQVAGLATLVSLLFAILPALRMSNLTVMGVLRGE